MFRVLVIDDNADMREVMRVMLESAGYSVDLAADGEAGLHAQRARPADVIVTDIFMPNRDGLEIITRLRADFPDTKVVAISGGASRLKGPSYLSTAREIGAHSVLTKPFEQADLLRAVRALLNEGRGAEVRVRLPLEQAPRADASGPAVYAGGGSYRVLVADDNRDAAESLAMLLRGLGNEVSIAYDGVEAVAAVRDFRPDVALLDIGMPRLDGYGAAREIRRQAAGERVRLVALTGWGEEEDRRRAREAGFDSHLVKPAELDALRRVLEEVAGRDAHRAGA